MCVFGVGGKLKWRAPIAARAHYFASQLRYIWRSHALTCCAWVTFSIRVARIRTHPPHVWMHFAYMYVMVDKMIKEYYVHFKKAYNFPHSILNGYICVYVYIIYVIWFQCFNLSLYIILIWGLLYLIELHIIERKKTVIRVNWEILVSRFIYDDNKSKIKHHTQKMLIWPCRINLFRCS